MSELPVSARTLGRTLKLRMEMEARRVRQAFRVRVEDAQTEQLAKKRAAKQFEVKGRIVGAEVRWDVFELVPGGLPIYRLGNFFWQEEAIAHARDLVNGKVSVSFGAARSSIACGVSASGIISPSRSLELPGGRGGGPMVSVRPNGKSSFIVSQQRRGSK